MVSGFLLDTNVISEFQRPRPDAGVMAWLGQTPERQLFLSAVTWGELRKGVELLEATDPKRALLSQAQLTLKERFRGRVLAIDDDVAERWGQLEATAKRRRVTLPTADALIAATALHHGVTLVTRNVDDFKNLGVSLLNPWHTS